MTIGLVAEKFVELEKIGKVKINSSDVNWRSCWQVFQYTSLKLTWKSSMTIDTIAMKSSDVCLRSARLSSTPPITS
jgi:hypothetical protein